MDGGGERRTAAAAAARWADSAGKRVCKSWSAYDGGLLTAAVASWSQPRSRPWLASENTAEASEITTCRTPGGQLRTAAVGCAPGSQNTAAMFTSVSLPVFISNATDVTGCIRLFVPM